MCKFQKQIKLLFLRNQ